MSESAQAALSEAEAEAPPVEIDTQPDDRKVPSVPAKPRASKRKTTRTRSTRSKSVDIAAKMSELYTQVGVGVSLIPSKPSPAELGSVSVTQAIGQSIVAQADAAGRAWQQLADENDQVRAALEKMLTVSVVGQLIAAHAPIAIMAATVLGAMPPAVGVLLGSAFDEDAAK